MKNANMEVDFIIILLQKQIWKMLRNHRKDVSELIYNKISMET